MFEWKEVSKEEWSSLPRKGDNIVTWHLAENYAETLFRKRASELGLSYDDVEDVFRGQNEQFFDSSSAIAQLSLNTIDVNEYTTFQSFSNMIWVVRFLIKKSFLS